MTLPPELIAAAVLGTGQHELKLTSDFDFLSEVAPASLPAEKRLLVMAASFALREQAGLMHSQDHRPAAVPCKGDERSPVHPEAMNYLFVMEKGNFREVLPEWFREVARAHKRIPEEYLPLTLSLGRQRKELRDLILPLIGERGQWLADKIRDQGWNWFNTIHSPEKVWTNGSLEGRLVLFENLRKSNSKRARELLAGYQDKQVGVQEAFLELLRIGLSAEDEPILETALNSTVNEARYVAADLLARLPNSAFNGRMLGRAEGLLTVKTISSGNYQLSLAQIRYDNQLKHDGIREDIPREAPYSDPQLWWAAQILSFVPPAYWCQKFAMTIDELLNYAQRSGHPRLFWAAWSLAVNRASDSEFAIKFLQHLYQNWGSDTQDTYEVRQAQVRHVSAVLDYPRREAIAIEWLACVPLNETHQCVPLLKGFKETWSMALTQAVLSSIPRHRRTTEQGGSEILALLSEFSVSMHPGLNDQMMATLEHYFPVAEAVSGIRVLLDFRAGMIQAIHQTL